MLKCLTIIALVLAGFGDLACGSVPADAESQIRAVRRQIVPPSMFVAQSSTQTPASQEQEKSPESQKSESATEEAKESTEPEKKSLKNFRPSEQIEAEQAVDFPYDI